MALTPWHVAFVTSKNVPSAGQMALPLKWQKSRPAWDSLWRRMIGNHILDMMTWFLFMLIYPIDSVFFTNTRLIVYRHAYMLILFLWVYFIIIFISVLFIYRYLLDCSGCVHPRISLYVALCMILCVTIILGLIVIWFSSGLMFRLSIC